MYSCYIEMVRVIWLCPNKPICLSVVRPYCPLCHWFVCIKVDPHPRWSCRWLEVKCYYPWIQQLGRFSMNWQALRYHSDLSDVHPWVVCARSMLLVQDKHISIQWWISIRLEWYSNACQFYCANAWAGPGLGLSIHTQAHSHPHWHACYCNFQDWPMKNENT